VIGAERTIDLHGFNPSVAIGLPKVMPDIELPVFHDRGEVECLQNFSCEQESLNLGKYKHNTLLTIKILVFRRFVCKLIIYWYFIRIVNTS